MDISNMNSDLDNLFTEFSQNSISMAYGIFSKSGKLIKANNAMCHYLDTNTTDLSPKNKFINPNFETIVALNSDSELVFDGILTIGNYLGKNYALNAKIFKRGKTYLVYGEPDAIRLFEENSKMSRLNQEVNNLQREIIKKKNELERLNELKNRFMGIASHDLRNPLNVVELYASFILDEAKESLSEEHYGFVQTIHKSSKYMIGLVDDLLEYSKIETGKIALNKQEFDLLKTIKGVIDLHKPFANIKHINIELNAPEEKITINADIFKLEQVFNNLLNNAIKFSYLNTNLILKIEAIENNCLISIVNTGDGIQEKDIETIFKPFQKIAAQGTQREKGSGLGLFIVKQIVDAHKGKIEVKSIPNKETIFTVILPIKA